MGKISLAITSSTKTWLKGSDIPHTTLTHIDIRNEEGVIARIFMSMDQFVRLLIGGSEVDCTLEAYRDSEGKLAKETVEPPETVKQRMHRRLGEVQEDFHDRLTELSKNLKEIQDGKVKPGKKVIENLTQEVEILLSHHKSNREYVAERAQEELEHLTEVAAAQLAGKIGASAENVAMLLGSSGQKALPAASVAPVPLEPTPIEHHERDERSIEDMGPVQLTETLHSLLRKVERTLNEEDADYKWHSSGATLAGNKKVMVTYLSYQGTSSLSLEEARSYAKYLAGGGKARHYEFFRNKDKEE